MSSHQFNDQRMKAMLPRDVWEVVYIFFDDLAHGTQYFDSRTGDEHHIFTRTEDGWVRRTAYPNPNPNPNPSPNPNPNQVRRTRDGVLRLNLDVLLYLDLTMSELGHQVAMNASR